MLAYFRISVHAPGVRVCVGVHCRDRAERGKGRRIKREGREGERMSCIFDDQLSRNLSIAHCRVPAVA